MQPIKIFFSFAPDSLKDRKYVSHLENHLADQKRLGEVKIWHVHKVSPGANVEQEILTNLKNADIILIFMSPDYMANDNCVDLEGNLAASMQSWGIATVRIILIRHIDWRNAPFNFCDVLPKSRKFISRLPYSSQEEALHDIALDISALVRDARNNRSTREANRVVPRPILHQTQFMPVMTPIESLIKKKQTDDVMLERHTDEVKLEKYTDEFKSNRRTEGLKQRKTNTGSKQKAVLADGASPSEYSLPPKLKTLPRTRRGSSVKRREGQNTYKLRSINITNWLNRANKEYNFMSKGKRGIFFFYPLILIDALGLPAAILAWSNSWILFGLTLVISFPLAIIGAVNTGSLIPIPLALLYASVWGIIIYHYSSWNTLDIIGIFVAITFIHLLLFRKNYR